MLQHEFLPDDAILILRPSGPLEAKDFEALAAEVDPYLKTHERLRGLCLEAPRFPGWKDFSALLAHLRFVHDHQSRLEKLAVVTDDKILSTLPQIIAHLLHPEVRHFSGGQSAEALAWLRG